MKRNTLLLASLICILSFIPTLLPTVKVTADVNVNFSAVPGSDFKAIYKDVTNSQENNYTMTAFTYTNNGQKGYAYSLENKVTSTNLNQTSIGANLDAGGIHRLICFANRYNYSTMNDLIGSTLANEQEYQGAIQLAVHKLNKERSSFLSYVSTDTAYSSIDQVANYLRNNFPSDESLIAPTTLTTKTDKILTLNTSDTTYDYYGPFSFSSNKEITPQVSFIKNAKGITVVNTAFTEVNALQRNANYFLRVTKNQQLPSTTLLISYTGTDTNLVTYGDSPNQIVGVVNVPVTLTENVVIAKPSGGGTIKISNTENDEFGKPVNGGSFSIKNDSGNIVQALKVTTNGVIYSQILPIGVYTIENTNPAPGYTSSSTKQVSILQDGQVIDLKMPSAPSKGKVQIINTDTNGIRLNGGVFKIYDSTTNSLVDTVTISENGTKTIELPDGSYYATQETQPIGVVLNESKMYFVIASTQPTPSVSVVNNVSSDSNHAIKITVKDVASYVAVNGGSFNILDVNDRVVDTVDINTSGFGLSRSLTAGTYKVKQATANPAYNISKDVYSVILSSEDLQKEVAVVNISKTNDPTSGGVKIVCSSNGSPVGGSIFGVFNSSGNEVARIVTDNSGVGYSTTLGAGSYTIKQLSASPNYQLNSNIFNVTLQSGQLQTCQIENLATGSTDSGSYNISVKDTAGSPVIATVRIKVSEYGSEIVQAKTNSTGAVIGSLATGSYFVVASVDRNGSTYTSNPIPISIVRNSTAFVSFIWDGTKIVSDYSTESKSLGYMDVTVVDTSENKLNNTNVIVVPVNGTTNKYGTPGNTGVTKFTLDEGSYRVYVSSVNGKDVLSDTETVAITRNNTSSVKFVFDGTRVSSGTNTTNRLGKNIIKVYTLDSSQKSTNNSKIILYKNSVEYESKTTTTNGIVEFANLADGNYSVKQATSLGKEVYGNQVSVNVSGGSSVTVEFAVDANNAKSTGRVVNTDSSSERGNKSISGYIFKDMNSNGIYDVNDELLTDVKVYLYSSTGAFLKEFTIGSDSKYIFSNLASKEYEVRFALPSGLNFTTMNDKIGSLETRSKVDNLGRCKVDLYESFGKYINCGYIISNVVVADPNTPTTTEMVSNQSTPNSNPIQTTPISTVSNTFAPSTSSVNTTGYVQSTNTEKGYNPTWVPKTGYTISYLILGGTFISVLSVVIVALRKYKTR